MTKPILNVVVTCTKQKRIAAPKELSVGALTKGSVEERFQVWKQRLSSTEVEKCKAGDLYSGDHWVAVKGFNSAKFDIKTWITSAGYGLLELDDRIAPYAATFSKANSDSIFNKVSMEEQIDASRLWWRQLTSWRMTSHSRSLKSLARSRSSEPFLVVASDKYLRAIGDDLAGAAKELDNSNLLSILSAGCKTLPGLNENLLPCDARLQHVVGGALRSVNTRVASHLISTSSSLPNFSKLKARLTKLMKDLPDLPVYDRSPVTDDDVLKYLLTELRKDSSKAHTPLLRKFRDGGRACEQSRFRGLYKQVKKEIS